jgi:LysM repeat protein
MTTHSLNTYHENVPVEVQQSEATLQMNANTGPGEMYLHELSKTDTLEGIAVKYGVRVRVLFRECVEL